MATIEIPDVFDVSVVSWSDNTCSVQVKLWGQVIYSQQYPFSKESELKVEAALLDAKRDFARRLYLAIKNV